MITKNSQNEHMFTSFDQSDDTYHLNKSPNYIKSTSRVKTKEYLEKKYF